MRNIYFWLAICASGITLGQVLLYPATNITVMALLITTAIWVQASLSKKANATERNGELSSVEKQVCKVVDDVNIFIDEELKLLNDSLKQIKILAEDAVKMLASSFNNLNEQVQTQSELVQVTLGGNKKKEGMAQMGVAQLLDEYSTTTRNFLGLINNIAKQRFDLVKLFNDLKNHTNKFIECALDNTSVPHADGEENPEVANVVKEIKVILAESEAKVIRMLDWDLELGQTKKSCKSMEITRLQLKNMQAMVEENLDQLCYQINVDVGKAVQSLQFEDIVSQLVGHAQDRLNKMNFLIEKLNKRVSTMQVIKSKSSNTYMEVIKDIQSDVKNYTEDLRRSRYHPVKQEGLEEGSIELF